MSEAVAIPIPSRLWTVEQTAEALSVSTTTVYRLVASGSLPHTRIGRALRFVPALVDEWIYENTWSSEGITDGEDTD